ncbi:beta-Ig-H3/fasciclin [Streptomyces sp. NPDC059009]|uniref:beta-Ig-H3/fasciclin n=1 Tax=Streptomyces sp. NPDC059009 TaxID=3346694 RepID=UPI00368F7087
MNVRRRIPRAAGAASAVSVAAVTLGVMSVLTAPAAHAADGTAPACINRYVTDTPNGFDVDLTNNCGRTMRVKVVVDFAGDSPCYILGAGQSKLYIYEGVTGTYDRTVVC